MTDIQFLRTEILGKSKKYIASNFTVIGSLPTLNTTLIHYNGAAYGISYGLDGLARSIVGVHTESLKFTGVSANANCR